MQRLSGDWEKAGDCVGQIQQLPIDKSLLPFTFTDWYETEVLLRAGEENPARAETARLGHIVGENRRHQLPYYRSLAVLARHDGDHDLAKMHLEAALVLAQRIGLPGEEWPIGGDLGRLFVEHDEQAKAQRAYQEAAVIIHRLAKTIAEEDLRAGFLAATPIRSILEQSEII